MKKRRNWHEFKAVLDENGITKLYHFTDRTNLESIINSGGLYSWRDCRENNIQVSKPGGSGTSHDIDRRLSLDQYVRLSFTPNHPMMYVAKKEGRIDNPVVLEINPSIIYEASCLFSDMNATKAESICADTLYFLKRIHFDTVKEDNHFNLDEEEVPYYQAEVLVNHFVPLKYITNIRDFDIPIPHRFLYTMDAYSTKITTEAPTAFVFLIDQSMSMKRFIKINGIETTIAEAAAQFVNDHISQLLHRCIKDNRVQRYYDIAVVGYGHEVYSAWGGGLYGRYFVSPEEIKNSANLRSVSSNTKKGQGNNIKKACWINARCDGGSSDYNTVYTKVESLIKEWIKERDNNRCYPPTIIHITDGLSLNNNSYKRNKYRELVSKACQDNIVVFNVIIAPEQEDSVIYPENKGELDDRYELVFDLSSDIPQRFNKEIAKLREDYEISTNYKAMVINHDISFYINNLLDGCL